MLKYQGKEGSNAFLHSKMSISVQSLILRPPQFLPQKSQEKNVSENVGGKTRGASLNVDV